MIYCRLVCITQLVQVFNFQSKHKQLLHGGVDFTQSLRFSLTPLLLLKLQAVYDSITMQKINDTIHNFSFYSPTEILPDAIQVNGRNPRERRWDENRTKLCSKVMAKDSFCNISFLKINLWGKSTFNSLFCFFSTVRSKVTLKLRAFRWQVQIRLV